MPKNKKTDYDEGFKRLLTKTDELINESLSLLETLDSMGAEVTTGQKFLKFKLRLILTNLRNIKAEIEKS